MKTQYQKSVERDGAVVGKGMQTLKEMAGGQLYQESVKLSTMPKSDKRPQRTKATGVQPLDTTYKGPN